MKYMCHIFLALFAASASFAATAVNLSTLSKNYEAKDGDALYGTLGGNYKITIAKGAKVKLNDVRINGTNEKVCKNGSKNVACEWAGLTCLGDCTIELSGPNIVKGFYKSYPGIQAAAGYTLTIVGNGSLRASSNGDGAGIGGGYQINSGNITIDGGDVTATGGGYAAGIGNGDLGTCGNITITDKVTKVVATKGENATYSISAGNGVNAGTITIGGTVVNPIKKSPYEFPVAPINLSTLKVDFEAENGDVLTGTLDGENQHVKITIADGAKITLKNAKINGYSSSSYRWAGLTCLGNCTIVLEGSNTAKGFYNVYPGIQIADGHTLTIEGDGSLDASSNGKGAGIGGNYNEDCGNIVIKGGKITATGGSRAAGIGGGSEGTIGDITISGGEVAAMGGAFASGIGWGSLGNSGNIMISGGNVAALGGEGACGIGSDRQVTITNDVTKVVAAAGIQASTYSICTGLHDNVIVDGVEMGSNVAKSLFVFPAPPAATLVDFETAGGKTFAVIDGDYSGNDALSIPADVSVDKVVFERKFPSLDNEERKEVGYYTIMFPFEIESKKVENVTSVFSFVGIGVDKENRKFVAVERVWCNVADLTECNYRNTKFEAYKPYLIQLKSGKMSISIDNKEPLVIKATPTAVDAFDVAQSSDYNEFGDYVFRGVVQGKTWSTGNPDLAEGGAAAYGFAGATATGIEIGQFVKVGEGASIKPFRGYIYKNPVSKKVKSNGGYLLRQTASIDDLPDVMDIVVVDRKKDGSEQTTVIGQFNSRTGEIRMNRTKRTYDLKGRSVRDASRMAKGVYLKK